MERLPGTVAACAQDVAAPARKGGRQHADGAQMIRTVALLLLGLLLSAFGSPARASTTRAAAPGCADFLAQMRLKPPRVVFAGCRLLPNSQGKPLRATYRVAGRHAAVAEAYLVEAIGLVRLRRSCCQWDAPERQFTGAHGRAFMLTMGSGETTVSRRAQWGLIRSFGIAAVTFTEEI